MLRARVPVSLRASACMTGPLLAGALAGRIDLGVVASTGAFAGFAVWNDPYRRRARVVAGLGVALTAAMALGTLVAPSASASAVVGGVFVAGAAYVAMTFEAPAAA